MTYKTEIRLLEERVRHLERERDDMRNIIAELRGVKDTLHQELAHMHGQLEYLFDQVRMLTDKLADSDKETKL